MKAHATEHGVLLLRGPEVIERLTDAEAISLALDLLATQTAPANDAEVSAAAAYGSIAWLSIRDVMELLRLPRTSVSRLMERFSTTHARVPGGDRYVARWEVESWAARVLAPSRRRAGGSASGGNTGTGGS